MFVVSPHPFPLNLLVFAPAAATASFSAVWSLSAKSPVQPQLRAQLVPLGTVAPLQQHLTLAASAAHSSLQDLSRRHQLPDTEVPC